MNRKYDYDKLEREYVRGDMSLRELAASAGMKTHSLIMEQSVKREWARKRAEFREGAANKAVELMASDEGRRIAKEARVRENAIDAIDEAITTMRRQMNEKRKVFRNNEWVEEPLVVIRAQDVATLIDRLQVLFGKPSNITEERSLGISLSAGGALGPDLLRGIVEATRGLDTSGPERSPLPRTPRAGPN